MSTTLTPGQMFPKITLPRLGGGTVTLGAAPDWQLIVVYRGKHCPLCKTYLQVLEGLRADFEALGLSVVVVSGDPLAKADAFIADVGYTGDVAYDLTIPQMRDLGLFVSDPRDPPETDAPFPEPGVFVVNADGAVQMLDVSNAPFLRPDLNALLRGIKFVRDHGSYPIRGRHGLSEV